MHRIGTDFFVEFWQDFAFSSCFLLECSTAECEEGGGEGGPRKRSILTI